MKKYIYVLIALLLVSCSDVIDKKPNLETVKEDIATIKEKYKNDYTTEDFAALSDELAGNTFRSLLSKGENVTKEGIKFEKTYKQYLDEIKHNREKKEKILAELKSAVSVEVLESKRERGTGIMADYDVKLAIAIRIKNTGTKNIQGIKGRIEIIDMFDKNIENLGIEETSGLDAQAEVTEVYRYDISFGDLKKIDQAGFDKLKFVWVPEKIVFADGSHIPVEDK